MIIKEGYIIMKKKIIITGVIVVIVVVMSIYLINRPKSLGNMNGSYTEQTTKTSTVSFSGEAGNKIKISFRSNIESGNLDVILFDSKGNAVYVLDKASKLETFYNLDHSDTYTLGAECNNFVGKFKVKVYKVN